MTAAPRHGQVRLGADHRQLERDHRVDVTAAMLCSREVLRRSMLERRSGVILNFLTGAALTGNAEEEPLLGRQARPPRRAGAGAEAATDFIR